MPNGSKAHRLVKADAAGVGQSDAGERLVKALEPQEREERRVKARPTPSPTTTFSDVGRDVHRPAVSGTFAVRAGIGISQQSRHHPRRRATDETSTILAIRCRISSTVGSLRLERDRRVLAERSINLEDLLGVVLAGEADGRRHISPGYTPSRLTDKPAGRSDSIDCTACQSIIRRNSSKRYWLSCGPAEASG